MNLTKLKRERASLLDKANALAEGTPTAEDFVAIEGLIAEADALQGKIETLSKLATHTAALDAPVAPRSIVVDETYEPTATAYGITAAPAWEKDPNRGFKSSQEFFKSIIDASQTGAMPENLRSLRASTDDAANTLNNPDGGFLVPEGMLPRLLQIDPEMDPMAGRTQTIPMATPSVKIPARVDNDHSDSVSGGFQVYRRAEASSIQDSKMELRNVTLRANSLYGLAYATDELISDSPISFAALIQQGFNQEFSSRLIRERLNGTGNGQFKGVWNSGAKIIADAESGQGANTVTFNNVVTMRSRCWGYSDAIWIANHDVMTQLSSIVDEAGNNIFLPSLREDIPDMLLGRPIVFSEYAKTLGTAGDIGCYNWSQYLEGTYQPIQGASSMHVRFVENEQAFRFGMRNDGQPWWLAPLTPAESSTTLSPFVILSSTRT